MTQNNNRKNINEVRIKLVAPEELKDALQTLANERNITLSALLWLVTTEKLFSAAQRGLMGIGDQGSGIRA